MKERGMIFNAEMVRALLDGRKTQTRRIIKDCTVGRDPISKFIQIEKKFIGCYPEDVPELIRECCPYGIPGDRIWVRETFCPVDDTQYGGEKWVDYRATPRYEAILQAGTARLMMLKPSNGARQSTCRAGPAAFCWK